MESCRAQNVSESDTNPDISKFSTSDNSASELCIKEFNQFRQHLTGCVHSRQLVFNFQLATIFEMYVHIQ
mgnify:CR=1 FL=1